MSVQPVVEWLLRVVFLLPLNRRPRFSTWRSFGCREATRLHQILKVSKPNRRFPSGLATFLGLAAVDELRVVRASLDGLGSAGAVEAASFTAEGSGVETAT